MKEKKITIKILLKEYSSHSELDETELMLVQEAKKAAKNAYAPYSKFNVGAALLLENGKVVTGNNQENAAYPSGLCAERVAVFYANSKYPKIPVVSIAVTAMTNDEWIENPVPPCGSCRQSLLETEMRFKKPMKVIMAGKDTVRVIENVRNLLPLNFDSDFLTKEE